MSSFKRNFFIALGSFIVGIVVYRLFSVYAAIAVPSVVLLFSASLPGRRSKDNAPVVPTVTQPAQSPPPFEASRSNWGREQPSADGPQTDAASGRTGTPIATPDAAHREITDPELASASEYIDVLQDMILLEGEKNTLDDEIVQKTLALLSRINRLIPDLDTLGDSNINYNIVRLVRRDLNSTINPFLRLSGEAKRHNRRLLLDGIKDINSKLTAYTQTIEQKDLLELRTKAELIQQRYRYND
ncbi:hypothetical protein [Cohnella hashimotonis]|uniref:Uncharacterized protein n=1 Tax=Cohnella hashimotonis TaxID=2826895 RepID=A0ABT6TFW2_9BACL|nr:hypothetical protein [Cohnella hashimotonis]MDI4644727.1 hypothetical protein [Cohnella hashimotonis]